MKMKSLFQLDQKGMTMVEVIVAFSVLMLTIAMFSRALAAAETGMIRSGHILEDSRNLAGEYYLDEVLPGTTTGSLVFKKKGSSSSFSVTVEVNKYAGDTGTIWDVTTPSVGGGS